MGNNHSEKVSVNINVATLSTIDLLVDHGYYSNRSDFINQALRDSLHQNQSTIDRLVESNKKQEDTWFLGIMGYTAADIEKFHQAGEKLEIRGYGMLVLDKKCDEEKLFAVVSSIQVKGKVLCSQSVKNHYGI